MCLAVLVEHLEVRDVRVRTVPVGMKDPALLGCPAREMDEVVEFWVADAQRPSQTSCAMRSFLSVEGRVVVIQDHLRAGAQIPVDLPQGDFPNKMSERIERRSHRDGRILKWTARSRCLGGSGFPGHDWGH